MVITIIPYINVSMCTQFIDNIIDLSHLYPGIYFIKLREELRVYSVVKI